MWECRDEFLLRGGECETQEKRIYIYIYIYFSLKMSKSVILTRNGTDKTLDLSLDLG